MTPCIDIGVAKNCKNPDSYGEICVRCNKCGRFDKYAEQEPTIRPSFSYTAEIKADDEQLERLQGILNGEMVLRLEQEPCDDAVSREAAIQKIKEHAYPIRYDHNSIENGMTITGIEQALNELPSVQPKTKTGM